MHFSNHERALHEAAHAVVAREFGFELAKTRIYTEEEYPEAENGGYTELAVKRENIQDLTTDGPCKFVIYCLAGGECLAMVTGDEDKARTSQQRDLVEAGRVALLARRSSRDDELWGIGPCKNELSAQHPLLGALQAMERAADPTVYVDNLRPRTREMIARPDVSVAIAIVAKLLQHPAVGHALDGNDPVDRARAAARAACRHEGGSTPGDDEPASPTTGPPTTLH